MVTNNAIIYLIVMFVWSPQVSSQDANCPQDCTLVNITASNFTFGQNNAYTTTGQASWVTDGVTSGPCASVSSILPAWEAEFTENRTVTRIKIFWEDQQDDVYVKVDGRICHAPDSSYMWEPEYTLECDVPLTGFHLLIYRQPTVGMLNLSFCEVEIYAVPLETSSPMSSSTTTTMPTTSKTLSTTKVTTSPIGTAFWVTVSTTAQTSNTMATPTTATAHPSETSTPPSGAAESPDSRFPLLYVIVVGGVAAGVVTVAVVAVVCVRRRKGKRPQARDAEEAVVPSYEMCVAEPSDYTQYQIIQSYRTPRGWSEQGSIYVNTT